MDMLQDQILKLQDRFDYFIMTQIKQGKMRIENFGSRKDTDEPHFDATTQNEQQNLFDELDNFKKYADEACMDEQRQNIR